ncbi:bifunctional diguanylate cyclase/phosphodiesterase [Burkholderia multivorans]|uniref:bifunctional diguanylate cyclase/phosphodiesterase n=1 Tax=Burkholderia multivorans TaxID=87883 RepID=UPI00285B5F7F|nr:EAL domain-containing protein [Burkholderia multivorans]MDR9096144.1 putative signaling protein [Burkholderia multivorans]MDR9119917.1 putative signaling protein [Burkholderia multivorans]MDR9160184.1 putative signaling protein [Burkholderia multivorans]MDR9166749.1 putative signaling protein [Burkholderia multivorans]MDR9253228.1 putative signaling protein [Burkholderia multivorans]
MKRSDEAVAMLLRKIRFGFAIGLSLVIAGGIGAFLWQSYRGIETRAYAETAVVARTVAAQMAERFARYDYLLSRAQAALQQDLAQGKPLSAAPLQSELALWQGADPEIVAVRIADASGRLIDQPKPVTVADRADFRLHQGGPNLGSLITGPVVGRITGDWVIIMSRRLSTPDGRFAGTVFLPLKVKHFEQRFAQYGLMPGAAVALYDKNLLLMARIPPVPHRLGKPLQGSPLIDRVRAGQRAGQYRHVTVQDGIERFYSYTWIEGTPLFVLIGLPVAARMLGWWQLFWTVIGLGTVVLALFWGLVWIFSHAEARARQRAEELSAAYAQTTRRLKSLLAASPDNVWFKDAQGRYVEVNPAYAQLAGLTEVEMLGKTAEEVWPAPTARQIRRSDEEVRASGREVQDELAFATAAGRRVFENMRAPVFGGDGAFLGMAGIGRDITQRKANEEDLRLAAVVFEQSAQGMMITDAEQRILTVNPAFTQMTGYTPEEVIGQTPRILQSGRHDAAFFRALWESILDTGHWQGEIWDRRKTGEIYPKWLSIAAVRDGQGKITHYIGIFTDITEQKAQATRIEQLAFYDPLTGLPNRALSADRLKQALAAAHRHGQRVALLFLDLNRFKEINDTQGHAAGDAVLMEVARRFQAVLRQEETLARIGGDEFVVIVEEAEQSAVAVIAERLQQALAEPIAVSGHIYALGVSIGIALYPEDGATCEDLLKQADIAMYRAKASGSGYRFYRPEMSAGLAERMALARDLQRALRGEGGELELYYQPQVDLQSRALIGAEALLRWRHPERGMLSPGVFVPIAEERNMMIDLGDWVLREACRQLKAWQEAGLNFPGRLAVNIAAQQIEDAGFAEKVLAIVRETVIAPASLELELTESGLMRNVEQALGMMNILKAAGFALAIDDFGTGYSSLAYLKRFPADKLKIDMSFVRDMLKDRHDYATVNTIISMARSFGLKAIAEGVEEAAQAESLLALGCDEAQGYYFGRPEPAESFAQKWLGAAACG